MASGEWLEKSCAARTRFLLLLENVFSFVSTELGHLSIRNGVAIRNRNWRGENGKSRARSSTHSTAARGALRARKLAIDFEDVIDSE